MNVWKPYDDRITTSAQYCVLLKCEFIEGLPPPSDKVVIVIGRHSSEIWRNTRVPNLEQLKGAPSKGPRANLRMIRGHCRFKPRL